MLYCRIWHDDEPWSYYIIKEYEDRDGGDNLAIRVEREKDPDAFSEWIFPDVACKKSFGFSEDDIFKIKEFLRDNESIMWDDWREEADKECPKL